MALLALVALWPRSNNVAATTCAPGVGQDLKGEFIINTLAFEPAPWPGRHYEWINTSSQTKYVRSASVWFGMDYGAKADLGVMLRRISDQSYLFRNSWDHYAEPTGLHNETYDFGENHYAIAPSDGLMLDTWFVSVPGVVTPHAHVHVTIRWTECP